MSRPGAEASLIRLGEATADAVAGVLATLAPDGVERGAVTVSPEPLAGIETQAVATSVSYVDGVTGGNVFVMTVAACRRLAETMGAESTGDDAELSELQLSAVSEAMNQMIAAAAGATSRVIGEEVEISTPQTNVLTSPADA